MPKEIGKKHFKILSTNNSVYGLKMDDIMLIDFSAANGITIEAKNPCRTVWNGPDGLGRKGLYSFDATPNDDEHMVIVGRLDAPEFFLAICSKTPKTFECKLFRPRPEPGPSPEIGSWTAEEDTDPPD